MSLKDKEDLYFLKSLNIAIGFLVNEEEQIDSFAEKLFNDDSQNIKGFLVTIDDSTNKIIPIDSNDSVFNDYQALIKVPGMDLHLWSIDCFPNIDIDSILNLYECYQYYQAMNFKKIYTNKRK